MASSSLLQVLTIAKRSSPLSDFTPTLHLSSCIRDLETPGHDPISWSLLHDDRAYFFIPFPSIWAQLARRRQVAPRLADVSLSSLPLWLSLSATVSIAALHTISSYRSLSLASHTVQNLAVHLQEAFNQLPEEFGLRNAGWIAADWNDGNPAGKGFFEREGWELLEEGVRWAKGVL